MAQKKPKAKNIGLDVKKPEEICDDKYCPFHGTLSVRGQVVTGKVASIGMTNSVIVEREYMHYVPKYERYEKRTSKYAAHCPPCLNIKRGDNVKIAECRPLSKTISFVAIEKI